MTKKIDHLLNLALKGPVRARDLEALGIPRTYLTRLCEQGLLERVGRGMYSLSQAEITEGHSLVRVIKRIPHAVLALYTALQFHEMTSEVPGYVWIMIERKAWLPSVSSPEIKVVRASGEAWTYGVEHHTIEGVTVSITSAAKTVADCFRYPSSVPQDVALEALRDYLSKKPRNLEKLRQAAKADKVYQKMQPYIEALL